MKFQVIVTLGPANESEAVLREIDALGPCLYRINGAHTPPEKLASVVMRVRQALPKARLMLDLPGNKVRTANLKEPLRLKSGETVELSADEVNYRGFFKHLKVGDRVLANDSIYTLEVHHVQADKLTLLSHSDGDLGNNKGLHVQGIHQDIPFLFEKDLNLIRAGSDCDVDIFSLSFVRTAEDVREAKAVLKQLGNTRGEIFAKVETLSAVKNLGHILNEVETINVDRGDLSTDVGLFELASYQERIIEAAKRAGKNVFLATQFLKNMEHYPVPLIAEIIDLHKTIKAGISGIQLSEETAMGKYPVDCVRTVFRSYYQTFAG